MYPTQRSVMLGLLLFVALVLTVSPTEAWWAKGHMTVAQIALRQMKNPDNQKKLDAIINSMTELGPYSEYQTCVDVAVWSDDLKSMGLLTESSWHFVNHIYNPSGYVVFTKENGDFIFANSTLVDVLNAKRDPVSAVNVEKLIPILMASLTEQVPYTDNTGKPPMKYSQIIVSSLSNLIHYVGDIHQPLHSTSLFTEEFPSGDRGGNSISVFFWNTTDHTPSTDLTKRVSMNLHAFWDSIGQGPQKDFARPLSDSDAAEIAKFAAYLESTYHFTDELKNELNSSVYASESGQVAREYVYNFGSGQVNTDIMSHPDGIFLSDTYLQSAKTAAEQRVALAGYRLAAIMDNILPSVTLDDINNGLNNVRAFVKEDQGIRPRTEINYYAREKDVTGAEAAGIVIACFALGCLAGGAIGVLFCACRRRSEAKKQSGNNESKFNYLDEQA